MKRLLVIVLAVVIVLATAATAYAIAMSISDAKSSSAGTEVTIQGTVATADGNEYTITDGTDTIAVEFGPIWYKAVTLAVGEAVSITGEVDKGKAGTSDAKVDGFSVTHDEGTDTVRSGPGKPPWAGQGGKGKGKGKDKAASAPGLSKSAKTSK